MTAGSDLAAFIARMRSVRDARDARTLRVELHRMAARHLPRGDGLRRAFDSEDLADAAFLDLVAASAGFSGSTWKQYLAFAERVLTRRIANEARYHRRKVRHVDRCEHLDGDPPGIGLTPSAIAAGQEDRDRLQDLIAEMPASLRVAIEGRLRGAGYASLAKDLGIEEVAARQRVSRGLKWLRDRWRGQGRGASRV